MKLLKNYDNNYDTFEFLFNSDNNNINEEKK